MVFLEFWQSTSSVSYALGWAVSVAIIVTGIPWMCTIGARSNEKYMFGSPALRSRAFNGAVLLWRLFAFILALCAIVYVFKSSSDTQTKMPIGIESLDVNITLATITDPSKAITGVPVFVVVDNSAAWKLSYFTNWNFFLILFYLLISLVISVARTFKPEHVPVIHKVNGRYQRIAGPSRSERSAFVTFLFQTQQHCAEIALPTAIFVTFFVWTYLIPSGIRELSPELAGIASILEVTTVNAPIMPALEASFAAIKQMFSTLVPDPNNAYVGQTFGFTDVMIHGMNTAILLIDFFVAGYRFNPTHFFLALIWGCVYTVFTLAMNTKYGMLCYPAMQTDRIDFLYFLGMTITMLLGNFFLFFLISKVKHHWDSKVFTSFLFAPSDDAQVDTAVEGYDGESLTKATPEQPALV